MIAFSLYRVLALCADNDCTAKEPTNFKTVSCGINQLPKQGDFDLEKVQKLFLKRLFSPTFHRHTHAA